MMLRQLQNLPPLPQRLGDERRPPASSVPPGVVTFGQLQRLPTNPAALKAWIAAFTRNLEHAYNLPDPEHAAVFLSLTNLVAALPAPPAVRAAAFRAVATLPNVTGLGPVQGGQGLRLSLGGTEYATLVVNTATSQARDILTVSGVAHGGGQVSVTAHWVNRLP
jgi:hypothetical protein